MSTIRDQVSLAHCTMKHLTGEPWLTIQHDEWMFVLSEGYWCTTKEAATCLCATIRSVPTVFLEKTTQLRAEVLVRLCLKCTPNLLSQTQDKELPEVLYHWFTMGKGQN